MNYPRNFVIKTLESYAIKMTTQEKHGLATLFTSCAEIARNITNVATEKIKNPMSFSNPDTYSLPYLPHSLWREVQDRYASTLRKKEKRKGKESDEGKKEKKRKKRKNRQY
jgi:hypothetical protein